MITKNILSELYIDQRLSMKEVSESLSCSVHKVDYWLKFHDIPKRSISDAIYAKKHPDGDPFKMAVIDTKDKAYLYGMGLGLYWGEGTKANKYSIRLGNTDPELIKMFISFLTEIYSVKKDDMRFGLQIFSDIDPEIALGYWTKELNVATQQFYKTHITISGSIGTYRVKSKYGVITVYYHNKRLRDMLVSALPR